MPRLQRCVLAGFPATARVVGKHVNGDYAAVYVLTHETDDRGDWLGIMRRTAIGWQHLAGGDGGQMWVLPPGEDEEHSPRR